MAAIIAPMLATPGPAPAGPGWAYEFKWDGVRAVTYAANGTVTAFSRNHREVVGSYPELREVGDLLAGRAAILDGEIVALDPYGIPSFAQLQRRMHVAEPAGSLVAGVPVRYYVFDLLELDGRPTLQLPYERRRELLADLELGGVAIRTPEHFRGDPAQVTAAAAGRGLEGIVAKRLASPYRPGRRSPDWIKTPFSHTQEVVIIGYKPGEGRRAGTVGSLVLAVTEPDGSLSFAGGVGTGFTQGMLTRLEEQLTPWIRRTPSVPGIPREHARGVRWVEPRLVGEVAFRNWTPDGRLRHPSWRGLRPDRTPAEARRGIVWPPSSDDMRVKGAMATPDGRWRVEVISRGEIESFRLVHDENVLDGLDLAGLEKLLASRGIDLQSLRPIDPAA